MKGIVFTELLEMVEDRWGLEVAEQMIEGAQLPNGGAYTAVGTYDSADIVRMVRQLSGITQVGEPELLRDFGECLFARFARTYRQFFGHTSSALVFLSGIETHIHSEVRKLYPEAELPTFDCKLLAPGRMEMLYRSARPFGDLAEGMIQGCIRHFGERIEIQREDVPASSGSAVRFTLCSQAA